MSLVVPFDEVFADKTKLLATHETWERVELGEVCEILNGFAFKSSLFNSSMGLPIIRIRDLARCRTETFYTGTYPREYLVNNGDLLIGMDGNFGCYEWSGGEALLNQRVCKITPDERYLLRKFLLFGINGYLKAIQDATSSVTVGHLSSRDIQRIPFPLPPLNEQHRIVSKLEKLLSRVDAAQARLTTIPRTLKRFRQSVLAAASSGKLTADWRTNNPSVSTAAELVIKLNEKRKAEYETACKKAKRLNERKPKPSHHTSFIPVIENRPDDIPANWCITRIGDVGECLDYKRIPVNKDERLNRQGTIPYYGANGQTGWINDYLFDEDLVLLVEDETFIGREKPFSYVIRGKSWVNNHAHVIRPCDEISADYLNICWSYYDFTPLTSGTTGRRKLTQEALLDAAFPVAPLAEQQEIVRRVEALFKTANVLEARYHKAKAHVDRLTQSILARAFRGELVTPEAELARQEGRDYESASALLERIKKERAKQQQASTRQKSNNPRRARKAFGASSTKLFT